MMTDMILIDLLKFFNTTEYDVLLQKLYPAGFSKENIKKSKLYLSNRSFLVNLENNFSQLASAFCDVPLDFILGPLFSLILLC